MPMDAHGYWCSWVPGPVSLFSLFFSFFWMCVSPCFTLLDLAKRKTKFLGFLVAWLEFVMRWLRQTCILITHHVISHVSLQFMYPCICDTLSTTYLAHQSGLLTTGRIAPPFNNLAGKLYVMQETAPSSLDCGSPSTSACSASPSSTSSTLTTLRTPVQPSVSLCRLPVAPPWSSTSTRVSSCSPSAEP